MTHTILESVGHPEPFGACHSERSEESTRLEGKLREGSQILRASRSE